MTQRRASLERYARHCPDALVPTTAVLTVPREYPFKLLRTNYARVVEWAVRRYVGDAHVPVGPVFSVRRLRRDARTSGRVALTVDGDADPVDALRALVAAARRGRSGLAVAHVVWKVATDDDKEYSRHRMVLLCDARDARERLAVYLVDPNGKRTDGEASHPQAIVEQQTRALLAAAGLRASVRVVAQPKSNVKEDDDTDAADSKYGIRPESQRYGKCMYLSLVFLLDILCTTRQSLTPNHFDRLVAGMTAGATGPLGRYNVLMYTRALAYRVLDDMRQSGAIRRLVDQGAWKGEEPPATPRLVRYDPTDPLEDLFARPPPPPPFSPPRRSRRR